ncbi:MAG: hypothetical protein QNJ33_18375 [Crocosphaera sp.]|nr:hypothetical protein [Crocosphaera sp.]
MTCNKAKSTACPALAKLLIAAWLRLTVRCIRWRHGSHISSFVVVGFLGGAIGGGADGYNGGE